MKPALLLKAEHCLSISDRIYTLQHHNAIPLFSKVCTRDTSMWFNNKEKLMSKGSWWPKFCSVVKHLGRPSASYHLIMAVGCWSLHGMPWEFCLLFGLLPVCNLMDIPCSVPAASCAGRSLTTPSILVSPFHWRVWGRLLCVVLYVM